MASKQAIDLPDFSSASVLVCGDVMLDRYWYGDVARVSPEAPVQVVNVAGDEVRPGGAANVAQNIAALGAKVTLCGLIGDDEPGQQLQDCLKQLNVACVFDKLNDYPTVTKLRVLSSNQQLIRMDFEKPHKAHAQNDRLITRFEKQLEQARLVVLSDYAKGALSQIEKLIELANKANVPILIDPKHTDYQRYAGATLLTPNLKEFEAVVGHCANLTIVIQKARDLLQKVRIEALLVTLGKDGMVLIQKSKDALHFPTQARDVYDVTGAGDTVIATLATCVAAGLALEKAVEVANIAAGIVVGRLGAQAVTISDLQIALSHAELSAVLSQSQLASVLNQARARGERIVMTNGCFDILHVGHVDYLAKAKAMGDRLLVAVNDDASIARLKGETRPFNPLSARMTMLAALGAVDWVVPFTEDTPARLISEILPDVLVKGDDYAVKDIAGSDVVLKNGGRVATVPLVPGFSTTAFAQKLKGAMI